MRTASQNLLLTPLAQHRSSGKSREGYRPFFNSSGMTEMLLLLLLVFPSSSYESYKILPSSIRTMFQTSLLAEILVLSSSFSSLLGHISSPT